MLDAQWPFVERDNELQTFDEAWTVRSCRVVAIFGPAGVGKSRLADELLMRAVDGGRRPVRVTANAASATVPLSAIAHLIPSGVDFSDPVAGFVEIARRLAGDQGDRQWAVLVEDLHLLDAASAALLRHLLDAGVARLIATVRTGERDSAAVQALAWGEAVGRIDLAPFDQDSVGRLLRVALDAPISRRAAHRLFEASGGNALYLRELVRGGLDAGALTFDGEIWELGDGAPAATVRLLELIGSRLAAVSPAGRRVLDLLALCEPVSLADAAATA
jgi:predicted ATPase